MTATFCLAKGTQDGASKHNYHSFRLNQIKNMVEIDKRYYDYADTLTPYCVAERYTNELTLKDRYA